MSLCGKCLFVCDALCEQFVVTEFTGHGRSDEMLSDEFWMMNFRADTHVALGNFARMAASKEENFENKN
jgi:hypothetical protein